MQDFRRRLFNRLMVFLIWLAGFLVVLPLFYILYYVTQKGFVALSWDLVTSLPAPPGEEGGGIVNSIVGSLKIVTLAAAIAIPWGIATGVYLSEFGIGPTAKILRMAIDLMMSVPSIVVGLFIYALTVKPVGHFSAYAGSAALAYVMIPIVARSTEEMLKLVPNHIREAGLALGVSRWKVILKIVLQGSLPGVMTGVVLAIARVAGETAPLLLTSLNNSGFSEGFSEPTSSLPVQIYTYAIGPYEEWHAMAWASSLVLVAFVLLTNVVIRAAFVWRK
ncbi:MAG: phosphate ABC transporter, permease protein PstA [Bdellovibrionales bacterium CG10_big_fil_rev_8_21_14_0_10_45_34]|nr:MAG: phosphate ABC transporter, permease protein PstA [Bdellovibrionales bacterium CG10_big_fil_rev_8_21_14_0_10_45_34]